MNTKERLRRLPSVDALLKRTGLQTLVAEQGRDAVRDRLRGVLAEMRGELSGPSRNGGAEGAATAEALAEEIERRLTRSFARRAQALTQRVINATGVVLHTNLGRAPLSRAALEAIGRVAGGYCNLEFDLATGKRGKRGTGLEAMLRDLLNSEAAAVVNNCAAAVFLVLNTLAEGGEVVVSRGELIEIGGSFRLPDVIAKSGARIREVGTTNRTRLADFEGAMNEHTRVILRSHPSNYRIVGFTERPALRDLARLARERGVPLFEDLGSGALVDLTEFGVRDEPTVQHSINAGTSVLAFSGDKLLGGPQSGIILGEKGLIERVKKNPLMRALRVDKLIFSALEATLAAYAGGRALTDIPALAAMLASKDEIARRALAFVRRARGRSEELRYELVDGDSVVGGGSAPQATLPTKLISVTSGSLSAAEIEARLRLRQPSIIARVAEDRLMIDLRTVSREEEGELLAGLAESGRSR
jgi:L-seryl-tRNA(Ser) seleniumtransferase